MNRVLTDTLVPVPSGPGSIDTRQMVFEAIEHHIVHKAKFPLCAEGELCCTPAKTARQDSLVHIINWDLDPCHAGDTLITLPFIFQ